MNYQETVHYLFTATPAFEKIGKAGYKEGLDNTLALDEHFGHPHRYYSTLHIAGTNGKGSCAHTLAAILQSAGLKVGLYTSPHLVDFRERIRINGRPIPEQYVVDFVAQERAFFEPLHPSFFELTTALAFKYFKDMKVDIAVIEVGLGGRLDCTNILRPLLSVITNISMDHMQFLGHTPAAIAAEKAGIIKPATPVVVGEATAETRPVFEQKAREAGAPIYFAEDEQEILSSRADNMRGGRHYITKHFGRFRGALGGLCQEKNTNTILCAVRHLLNQPLSDDGKNFRGNLNLFREKLKNIGTNFENIPITIDDIRRGFSDVCLLTGLMGRWQRVSSHPDVVCDTGHNEGAFAYIVPQLKAQRCQTLRIVFGMVGDKDICAVLRQLPRHAVYYFTQAQIGRALPAGEMKRMASSFGLAGQAYPTVEQAYHAAKSDATAEDFIYIGGSSYVVADFLTFFK